MPKIKLTEKETSEYRKLFIEDRDYFTIVDFLKQDKNFSFLKNYSMYVVFIEFLSNIFEIKWDKDVFENNHNRLLDIMMGIIYSKDVEKNQQAEDIFNEIKQNFLKLYSSIPDEKRYFLPHTSFLDEKIKNLPDFSQISEYMQILKQISLQYIAQYKNSIIKNIFPEWNLGNRNGIFIDETNYEPLKIEPEKWLKSLLEEYE